MASDWQKTGGPAFPALYDPRNDGGTEDGMTLRDYFAAAALQGIISNLQNPTEDMQIATLAYGMADAMLAAREK